MRRVLTIISIALFLGISVQAGLKDAKKRMASRLAAINKLKSALVIGEDNKGYLAVKGKVTSFDQKTLDAENADRRHVYEILAARTGTSLEKVQARRAAQIASKSQRKLWLQKADGTWYKK